MFKNSYNTVLYPFRKILEKIFDVDNLSFIRNDDVEVFKRENDQSTIFHKKYYEWTLTDEFTNLYENFIQEYIYPLYNKSIVYQKIPTFRIHFPNNIAVGEFHKDKQYREDSWSNFVKEDNFFLPFTNAFDTNTIWVESKEDMGDFSPMKCNYGEFIKWDGSNLTHGNKINLTNSCRVSVDFRVIKYSNYKHLEKGSINTKSKFKIGEYYNFLK